MKWVLLYYCIMNLLTYGVFAVDKNRALKSKWRIPEARLLAFSVLGGGLGGWRGMIDYHHKTNKWKFKVPVPIFALAQIIALLYLYVNVFSSDNDSLLLLVLTFLGIGFIFILLSWIKNRRRR